MSLLVAVISPVKWEAASSEERRKGWTMRKDDEVKCPQEPGEGM